MSAEDGGAPPRSLVVPAKERSWVWLLPVAAVALVVYLGFTTWGGRGTRILVHASDGHGIRAGAALSYRGVAVGEVVDVELSPTLDEVHLRVRLDPGASGLARAGSRFWIVRPHVGLDRVMGLEALLGARHLAVLPGPEGGERQLEFFALEAEPIVTGQGGLEIVLEAPRRFGLGPGAPVVYREIEVGTVRAVGLASDATSVEVRVRIRAPFVSLVREDTRFWEAGGLEISFGLMGGLDVDIESMRSFLMGGIAMATPTRPGAAVRTGHRFRLHGEPEEDWLEWEPALPVGSHLATGGVSPPKLLRARLAWEEGLFDRDRSRSSWVLPVAGGVVGPRDVLEPPEDAEDPSLELRGERLAMDGPSARASAGLALRELGWTDTRAWPPDRSRDLSEPEDCLIATEPGVAPIAVAAVRLSREGEAWRVDPAISLDEGWHGAAVLAREDGLLVGLLLVRDGGGVVAPVAGLLPR